MKEKHKCKKCENWAKEYESKAKEYAEECQCDKSEELK
jgi:hypothetical protein